MENRAYYMTIAIQEWLGARLDLLGNFLVLGIALFAAGFRKTISPSDVGVVLSYTLSSTSPCSLSNPCILTPLQLPRCSVSIDPIVAN